MVSNTVLRLILAASIAALAYGQAPQAYRAVTLAEASERVEPDYRPKLLGEPVKVRGIVASPVLEASDASYLPILDEENRAIGLLLLFSGDNRHAKPPATAIPIGTIVEVSGTVSLHAGQAVVKPIEWKASGRGELPKPPVLTPLLAASFAYEGMIVDVEGEVTEYREGNWGDLLDFKERGQAIQVFLPMPGRSLERPLSAYQKGDRIHVRGLVTQFCLRPPYNQYFQLMVSSPKDIELMEPRPAVPPQVVPAAVLLVLLGIIAAWYAQQRARWQQQMIQKMLQASEEIYGLGTAREVAETLRSKMIEFTRGEMASVYHYDATRKVLERIPDQLSSSPHAFHIEECSTPLEEALAACVEKKGIMQTTSLKGLDANKAKEDEPKSVIVIPMRNHVDVRGAIIVIGRAGKQLLIDALHPAGQHMANDACQYFEWLEQTAHREQTHRSEKLAVAGQLIHGVITELNTPLERIRDLTAALGENDAAAIHAQVKKASETVRRIVSVARAEQFDARPVDLRFLFQRLIEEMDEEFRQGQVEPELNLGPDNIYVLGSQEQLSRVFENLFLHAKAAATYSLEHVFVLNLNRLGRSAMIEIEFSGPFAEGEGPDFSGSALGLAITRGLVQSYGGEVRFTTVRAGRYRYDVELPALSAGPAEDFASALPFSPARGLITALMVEPEQNSQRKMLAIFGELNHRLIPVGNVEEAVDLAEKMRFDIVFASSRPEGGTWADLFARIHHRTPFFVLMSESAEEPSAEILDGTASATMRKPIEEGDVLALLEKIQQRN